MANPDTTPTDPPEVDADTAAGTGFGIKGKLMAVAFVLVVVLAECAIAVLVFPSADDTAAMTQAMLAAKPDSTVQPPEPPPEPVEPDEKEEKEVDLGAFDVSSYQPLSDTTLRISLHLYGTVLIEDETEITNLLEAKQQRMREQVLVILRSAELTDLTDAGLGLIKRKILEKTNRTFGKPLLQQIIFGEFSFLEQ